MEKRSTVYGMVLTYGNNIDLNLGEYKDNGDTAILSSYKDIANKHLNALLASIRRHKTTKKGAHWDVRIRAVASCVKGQWPRKSLGNDKTQVTKKRKKYASHNRDRLHVHLLVEGSPGATVANYIKHYWSPRFGLVKHKKYSENQVGEFNDYYSSQSLVDRKLKI